VVYEGSKPMGESNTNIGIAGAAVALVFAVSAWAGEQNIKDCRNARLIWNSHTAR